VGAAVVVVECPFVALVIDFFGASIWTWKSQDFLVVRYTATHIETAFASNLIAQHSEAFAHCDL
jgi:hypothetical protein